MTGNSVTHWWDGSMLYGSTQVQADSVRTVDGKLILDDDDEMAYVGNTPRTGFSLNWWAGLHVMHTIFAREHNYIVEQLEIQYSGQYSVDEKFQIARLCVSALMAKIHTIEWTPTLLDNPGTQIGLNANWRGGEEVCLNSFKESTISERLKMWVPPCTISHFARFSST
jgi:Animal haem peroxidase